MKQILLFLVFVTLPLFGMQQHSEIHLQKYKDKESNDVVIIDIEADASVSSTPVQSHSNVPELAETRANIEIPQPDYAEIKKRRIKIALIATAGTIVTGAITAGVTLAVHFSEK